MDQKPFSSRLFHSLAPTLAKPSEAQDSAPFNADRLRLRRGGLNSIHPRLEELDPARRPASAPARRAAPSRAAVRPLAPLCRGALPCRASQRALGWPVRLSLLLPPRSRLLPAPRGPSMLAPSPPARTPPAPRTRAALPSLLCASSLWCALFPPAFSLSELISTYQYDGTCRGPVLRPKAGSTSSEFEKVLVKKGLAGKGPTSSLRSGSRLPLTFASTFASNPAVLRPLHPLLLSPDSLAVPRTGTRT